MRETGIIEEEILLSTSHSRWSKNPSTDKKDKTDSKDKSTNKDQGNDPGHTGKDKDEGKVKVTGHYSHLKKVWNSPADSLRGISQDSIDKNKASGKDCIRCGFDGHRTVHCRRKKNAEGNDLPPAPQNTTNEKRAATESASKRKPDVADTD